MEERYLHNPVLIEEAVAFLNPLPGKIIVDATVGGAGHSEEILRRISPGGMLIGIDRDKVSLKIAYEKLKGYKGSFKLINKNFKHIEEMLKDLNIQHIDGILFDLGMSSIQMDAPDRGFSIKNNGPLDMRMDRSQKLTARNLVNELSEVDLSELIRDFGEERFHKRIAKGIVSERKKREILTTSELAKIVSNSIPGGGRMYRIHPATRTFQAFRIAVNDELSSIEQALRKSPTLLNKGGRICIISFHSLEDRLTKFILREFKDKGLLSILTKKPIVATPGEVLKNPRSRSAKLRAAERM